MTEKLYEICILQPEKVNAGLDLYQPQIEAIETDEGLQLYECELMPEEGQVDIQTTDWGTLSLDGWQTLCEMLALRHPERFAQVVRRWQALLTQQHGACVVPEVVTWLTDQGWTVRPPGGGVC